MNTAKVPSRGYRPLRWLLAATLPIAVLAGIWLWRGNPAPLLWSDLREGDGAVLSLTTGRDPSGNEIVVAGGYFRTDSSGRDLRIVCYDASNGRVRWEAREDKALPNMMTDPIIAIDRAGDVLVGWEIAAARLGANKAVSKIAGSDGRPLWDWSLESNKSGASMTAIPIPSQSGTLWISGIRNPGDQRFIAELNPMTGVPLWEHDLNTARDGMDRPAQIHHLKEGGAIVVVPPESSPSWTFPWIIQHRLKNGDLKWKHEIIRDNDRSLQSLGWLVDEANGQLVVSWNSVTGGRMHFDLASLDLATGNGRWHVRDPILADDFRSGVEAVTAGTKGGIELWGRQVDHQVHTRWWRWRMDHGIPYPEREREEVEQPLRVTLSPTDGSVMNRGLPGRPMERIAARLVRPGATSIQMLILCSVDHLKLKHTKGPSQSPWRADTILHPSWRQFLRREPAGWAGVHGFPDHAALTPSGRLVIGGDPAEPKRQWQIRAW